MKACELVKKWTGKLLGKKTTTPAAGQYSGGVAIHVAPENVPVILLLDQLGAIQLHPYWRN
jgi:hypothetical protein